MNREVAIRLIKLSPVIFNLAFKSKTTNYEKNTLYHIVGYRYIVLLVMYRLYQCGQILYDQVSLDSAFSKRVYVEGWLSSAYSVMDYIGEYREPFRWASDDLYHPDMKDYVEGNYSADNQLGDEAEARKENHVYGNIMREFERLPLSS